MVPLVQLQHDKHLILRFCGCLTMPQNQARSNIHAANPQTAPAQHSCRCPQVSRGHRPVPSAVSRHLCLLPCITDHLLVVSVDPAPRFTEELHSHQLAQLCVRCVGPIDLKECMSMVFFFYWPASFSPQLCR